MITANMHEAKTHLSKLVRAVEEDGEIVLLQRQGKPVAEIHPHRPASRSISRLMPDPSLRVTFAPGYDPAEPASEDEWPEKLR